MKFIFPVVFLFLYVNLSIAENPLISGHLVNLSAMVNTEFLDDIKPEMLVVGNSIHVAWMEYKYGSGQWLYYRRSADKGKSRGNPQQVLRLSIARWDRGVELATRFLAADGNSVHIAMADHKDDKRIIL